MHDGSHHGQAKTTYRQKLNKITHLPYVTLCVLSNYIYDDASAMMQRARESACVNNGAHITGAI